MPKKASKATAKPSKAKVAKTADHSAAVRLYTAQMQGLKRTPLMKEDYVDVKSSTSAQISLDPTVLAAGLLRTAARAALGRDQSKIVLYNNGQTTAGAGATTTASFPLAVSSTTEWSAMASLFDEVRVDMVKVSYVWGTTVINASGIQEYAVGYDSTRNVTPSSIPDVLESPQHQRGCFHVGTCYSTADQCIASRDGGYRDFKIKMQHNDVANAAAVTGGTGQLANFPGMWMDTQLTATNAYSVGYLRFYSVSLGGTNVTQLRYILEFHCTFKERT